MNRHFTSTIKPPAQQGIAGYWFIFKDQQLLVIENEGSTDVPWLADPEDLGIPVARQQYLGYLDDESPIHCFSAEIDNGTDPAPGISFQGLRSLYGRLPDDLFWLAGRAVQIVDWDRTHQYCSRCGKPAQTMENERAKKCSSCGFTSYPRLSPAMIVRVCRKGPSGPEILLARAHHFRPGMYSVLAGFVEPGETVEQCVEREIFEEVGLRVKDVRYFGSQPWPFPNSLMLAFTAEYDSGDIVLEEEEMDAADWFAPESLPQIPAPISISRRLIDDFIAKARQPAI